MSVQNQHQSAETETQVLKSASGTLQGPLLVIVTLEQYKSQTSRGTVCTVCFVQAFLKTDIAAFVWEAAPCSTLPPADENAVTESEV